MQATQEKQTMKYNLICAFILFNTLHLPRIIQFKIYILIKHFLLWNKMHYCWYFPFKQRNTRVPYFCLHTTMNCSFWKLKTLELGYRDQCLISSSKSKVFSQVLSLCTVHFSINKDMKVPFLYIPCSYHGNVKQMMIVWNPPTPPPLLTKLGWIKLV